MSKWIQPPKRYGGREDNEKMAEQYLTQQKAKRLKKEKRINNIKKFCRIMGLAIVVMGTITIGIGTFSNISCTGVGIIAVGIGLLMKWATYSIYQS